MTVDSAKKQAFKDLRAARRHWVDEATAASRFQKKTIQAIREFLENEPATVPQIAAAVDLPAATVLWFVAGMKKYGQIVEAGQDDSYFRYALVAGKPAEADTVEAEA
jgi:ectoine hydroxylase-related dioxygenase (phytanoyl-CoA dioxygenase family)